MGIKLGMKTPVRIARTYSAPVTITAISKANPAVVTAAGHGYEVGDKVVLENIAGMAQLDGQAVRVGAVTATTFELERIDSTGFDTFISGVARKATAFDVLANATSLNAAAGAAATIDVTTLIDDAEQTVPGRAAAPTITVDGHFRPLDPGPQTVMKAAEEGTPRIMWATFSDKEEMVANVYLSASDGFSLPTGGVGTTSFTATRVKKIMYYPAAA